MTSQQHAHARTDLFEPLHEQRAVVARHAVQVQLLTVAQQRRDSRQIRREARHVRLVDAARRRNDVSGGSAGGGGVMPAGLVLAQDFEAELSL